MHKPTAMASALLLALSCSLSLSATENGGSVYPVGAETVLPGLTPQAGQTELYESPGKSRRSIMRRVR